MKCSSGRKALQPRNIFQLTPEKDCLVVKPKQCGSNNPPKDEDQKENHHLLPQVLRLPDVVEETETIDTAASLAEELSAFKKKLERLREDRERTAKLLKERDGAMDLHMTHLLQRGETQKGLEIQVDRLFRLKELHYAYDSSKISPISSLRAKEQEKRNRLISFEPTMAGEPEEERKLSEEASRSRERSPPIVDDY